MLKKSLFFCQIKKKKFALHEGTNTSFKLRIMLPKKNYSRYLRLKNGSERALSAPERRCSTAPWSSERWQPAPTARRSTCWSAVSSTGTSASSPRLWTARPCCVSRIPPNSRSRCSSPTMRFWPRAEREFPPKFSCTRERERERGEREKATILQTSTLITENGELRALLVCAVTTSRNSSLKSDITRDAATGKTKGRENWLQISRLPPVVINIRASKHAFGLSSLRGIPC